VTYALSASQSVYLLNTTHATIPSIIHSGYYFRASIRASSDHTSFRIKQNVQSP